MFILAVHARVKPEHVEAFCEATLENARESRREPGVARFDVLQDLDDPTRFTLIEVYRTPDDPARHKETAHYAKWRDAAEDMLAEPRTRARYRNLAPDDPGWEMPGA